MSEDPEKLRIAPHLSTNQEIDKLQLPAYPVLGKEEVWDGVSDLRHQLPQAEQAQLRGEERVIHIHDRGLNLPEAPVSALAITMKAANAGVPEEIGFNGPTVASVSTEERAEASRYERQHGRDDLLAARHIYPMHPQALDTAAVSLAGTQGMTPEIYIPGQPYGFEKPGSIILVNFQPDDPLGQKFLAYKGWKPRFYGSADAPGLFVDAIATLQAAIPDYLVRRDYTAIDGNDYTMSTAFSLSVDWMLSNMAENHGLIAYKNPYTDGRGMRNQGWKDGADAMVHTDGSWANSMGGIAPIEIQCQAISSLRKAEHIYRTVYQNKEVADDIRERTDYLWKFLLENGWVTDSRGGHPAMGWDWDEAGKLRRIETRSLDMYGMLELLDTDDPDQAEMAFQIARNLTSEDMLTRWGSRVMAADEKAYGHLRYHCGVWPNKSNDVAESMSRIGLYGVDRALGALTTNLIRTVRCIPEHISGEDSEYPVLPDKDVYVYNVQYNEVYLVQQAPPLAQTWGATSELRKQHRYGQLPMAAETPAARHLEKEILRNLDERYPAATVSL